MGLFGALSRFLFDPIGIAILLLVGAVIADRYGRQRLARGLVAGTLAFLVILTQLPVDDMLARPLEDRYPRPALPARVDGILVLSGALKPNVTASRGVMPDNGSVMRMIAGAELARRYPKARLVFSGTAAPAGRLREVEFASAETFFRSQGIAPGRTLYDKRSLDTDQNIEFSRELVKPKPGEVWVLVTSAMHMPRAMAVANKDHWKMIPWAADYQTTAEWHLRNWKTPADGFQTIDKALHEWAGRLSYALTGRS
jgi:uncharacterized SAM-binding protein YcdF (DUF218 family)